MKKKRFIYLTGKDFTKDISSSEAKELKNLLLEHEEFQDQYDQLERSWEAAGKYRLSIEYTIENSWNRFQDSVKDKSQKRVFVLHPLVKVAAVILLSVGIGWLIMNPLGNKKYQTGFGEQFIVQLSDNSIITLNESSFLIVDDNFGDKERRIEFKGEAFFDIADNLRKPFIITTQNSQIEVLGTSFNVDAKDGELVKVDVTSGKVSLHELGKNEQGIILAKGMSGIFDSSNNSFVKSEYETRNFQSWRTKTLEFNDIPMKKVIEDVSEYFDVKIDSETEAILSCNLTSSFNNPTLDEVLRVISATLDLTIQENGQKYQLEGKGCIED
ncbi:MAG: hypothetical protein BalsKO_24480 [Balneolaceae bacterium]